MATNDMHKTFGAVQPCGFRVKPYETGQTNKIGKQTHSLEYF